MLRIPNTEQRIWQQYHQFALFFHFGINTFHEREWSDGSLDPTSFSPTDLNCQQWVRIARQSGAAHVILTAKHHDGFCLWPTSTTDYSVASSPWKQGAGDVVGELARACADAGIGLGLYLSPWDRHDPDWSENPALYDERYVRQLTELCTNYGPLTELWFDGAGSEQHAYDWDAIVGVVREHQPNALIFNIGDPDIRWIGNEDGLANDPVWYETDALDFSMYSDDQKHWSAGTKYCPPECDVPMRAHWFWQPDDLDSLKSVDHLMAIWYRSVGLGANLLLNVGPDRSGRIDPNDERRLLEFTAERERRFSNPIHAQIDHQGQQVIVDFGTTVSIDHIELREHLECGQRVRFHRVLEADGSVLIENVLSIGSQRIHAHRRVEARQLMIELEGEGATLDSVRAWLTGHEAPPELERQTKAKSAKFEDVT